jgi:hypothetical protein
MRAYVIKYFVVYYEFSALAFEIFSVGRYQIIQTAGPFPAKKSACVDLTWLFGTKRCGRMSLERRLVCAEEEV